MFSFHDSAALLSSAPRSWLLNDKFTFFSFRWEVIANYMNQHSTSGMKRTAKDVINKAKNLQRLGKLKIHLLLDSLQIQS